MQKYIVDTTGKDQGQISKATTRIRSSGGVTQTLLRMALWFGRIKLDCADAVQVRGGAKIGRSFIVICPALTFFLRRLTKYSLMNYVLDLRSFQSPCLALIQSRLWQNHLMV